MLSPEPGALASEPGAVVWLAPVVRWGPLQPALWRPGGYDPVLKVWALAQGVRWAPPVATGGRGYDPLVMVVP